MLNDLLGEIEQLHNNNEFSRRFIKTLETYRARLVSQLEKAEATLQSLRESGGKFKTQTAESIVQGVKEDAKFILQIEIITAVRDNREFAFPLFLEALLSVADNPDIFSIKITGTGRNTRVRATINFEGGAGNLSDWAKGVEKTRKELKISRGADAERASRIWREKIYQNPGGPYHKTIRSRIENSGKPAAFWQLLDKGTTTLASDRGGTAFPSYNKPTNFIDKAETKIESQFRTQYQEFLSNSQKSETSLQEEIARAKTNLAQIDSSIDQISIELEKNKQLYGKFSSVATYVDQNKLDNVLARIRLNLDVNVTKEGRVELGITGRRYRPVFSKLVATVGGY